MSLASQQPRVAYQNGLGGPAPAMGIRPQYFRPRAAQPPAPAANPMGYAPSAPAAPAGPGGDPNGAFNRYGHSANFIASVHANNAQATAKQDTMAAGYRPSLPRTNPDGSPAMRTITGTAPDGSTVSRQVQQYDDAPETVQARAQAGINGHAAAAASRGGYFAGLSEQQRQQADAADPKGAEARAHADAYRATADKDRALTPHQAGEIDAQANAHNAGAYKTTEEGNAVKPLTDNKIAVGNADVSLKGSQGRQADANANHTAAMTPVDVKLGTEKARDAGTHADLNTINANLRPGESAAVNARNYGEAHHAEALAENPHITPPGHEYAAQRQHVDDQINELRTRIASAGNSELPELHKQLNALAAQKTRLSGQHYDQAAQPAAPPPAAPAQPAPVPATPAAPPPSTTYYPGSSGSYFGGTDPTLSLSPGGYRPGLPSSAAPAPAPAPNTPPPVPAAATPPATGGPARVASDAEFHALPSGAEFVGPDGRRRRKP